MDVNTKLQFFVPISKVDEEQRMVYGIATNSSIDKQNEIVDWGATKDALLDYSQWRNIREMHKPSAVGTAPLIETRDATQEVYIGAKIIDDQAWQKCKEGVYKGFSIGGEVLDRRVEINKSTNKPVNRVTKYVMNEISVVDRPANPQCVFQTMKRDTSIKTVTITEDPLKAESARVMEKAVFLAKKSLTSAELEALPDNKFGLIKVVTDGDDLIKHRLYPMPDNAHAINMVRKMVGCEDLSADEKVRIHTAALSVLGKKHVEGECSYCIKQKLEGGVAVEKREVVEKATPKAEEKVEKALPKTDVPEDATPKKCDESIAVKTEEQAPQAAAVNPLEQVNAKLDRVIGLLADLLGGEEQEQGKVEAAPEETEELGEEESVSSEETTDGTVPETTGETAEAPVEEPVEEPTPDAGGGLTRKKTIVEECYKGAGLKAKANSGLLAKVKAIVEPVMKENAALKTRLEKMEKAPLPRKGAVGDKVEKVEKYTEKKDVKQDMTIEKREMSFSDTLQKDISKASELRKSGKVLSADEQAFCQRVAEKMLEEKLTKVS
jgi:hypothetical protein